MKVEIVYKYESVMGQEIVHWVIAHNDAELTEYTRRLAKAGYDVISVKHI